MILSLVSTNVFADGEKETFTFDYIEGRPKEEVTIKGERAVIYCMQHDYAFPTTSEGHGSGVSGGSTIIPKTEYWLADDDELLLTPDQTEIIQKVLYAGYPHDSVGALKPIYSSFIGEIADDYAAGVTQHIIWEFMAKWGISGNDHVGYETVDSDELDIDSVPEFQAAYDNIMNFVESGKTPESIPTDFEPTLIGDTSFKLKDGEYKTGPLYISTPSGTKLIYHIIFPDEVTPVDENGDELLAEYDILSFEYKDHIIYGDETFYLVADDPAKANGKEIEIETTINIPTKIKQYNNNSSRTVMKPWNDNIGVDTPYQAMLGIGITPTKLSGTAKIGALVADISITKAIESESEDAAAGVTFEFELELLDESGERIKTPFKCEKFMSTAAREDTIEATADGIYSFELRGSETMKVKDVPVGTSYRIREIGSSDKDTAKGKWTPSYSSTGDAVTESGIKITITNEFEPDTDDPAGEKPSDDKPSGDKPSGEREKPSYYEVPDTSCK